MCLEALSYLDIRNTCESLTGTEGHRGHAYATTR
jgi:hypothetical protein